MRAVSAKALSVQRMSMFLRCKRNNYRHENTQGAATLYPGLCAFALTARVGCNVWDGAHAKCIDLSIRYLTPLSPWRGAGGEAISQQPSCR